MAVRPLRLITFVWFTFKRKHLPIGSNCHEVSPASRSSLCDRSAIVLGDDFAVMDDQIRRLLSHAVLRCDYL
jgi:hypothetical protein